MSESNRSPASLFRACYLLALSLGLAACGSQATRNDIASDGIDHSGRMRGYVESSRVTDFCPDQSERRDDERCVVTRGWDYARGQNIVRTFDPNGNLIATQYPPGADLSLTEPERQRAAALVKLDPRTRDIVNKPDVMLWHGGFAMREPGDPFLRQGFALHSRDRRREQRRRCDPSFRGRSDERSRCLSDYVPSGRKAAHSSLEH